jgi:hypothetical protein
METSDAIAAASLFVSALALGYTILASRHERANRRKEIETLRRARIKASETKPRSLGFHTSQVRYAVELSNAGRASAHGISTELLDAQEGQLQEPKEIGFLPPDQTEYVEFELTQKEAQAPAAAVRVEWRDEEGQHSETFPYEGKLREDPIAW